MMKPQFFKTLWGHSGPYREAAQAARDANFYGLEGQFPRDPARAPEFLEALAEFDLDFIAEISTTGYAVPEPGSSVNNHVDAFERILDLSLPARPRFFSTMCGSDLWSFSESIEFFNRAHAIVKNRGVRCGFETHRSRSLYHPV